MHSKKKKSFWDEIALIDYCGLIESVAFVVVAVAFPS